MAWALLRLILVSVACAQQTNLAEPQYQFTGKSYQDEAAGINQDFLNLASAVKALQAATPTAATVGVSANNIFTGNNTFQSSVTISGGLFGTIDRSSQTLNWSGSVSSTTFGSCVPGSSATYVFQGSGVAYGYLNASFNSASGNQGMNMIFDGGFIAGESSTSSTCGCVTLSIGQCSKSCYTRIGLVGSGSHTLCASFANASGNPITINPASNYAGSATRLEQH